MKVVRLRVIGANERSSGARDVQPVEPLRKNLQACANDTLYAAARADPASIESMFHSYDVDLLSRPFKAYSARLQQTPSCCVSCQQDTLLCIATNISNSL